MADDTSAQAPARGWRLVVLSGFVGFTLTFAVFHFILPVRLWESSASESSVSLFLCAVVAVLTAAVVAFLLSRNLRLENQRMRSAINNMSQGLCMFDGNVAVQTAKATGDISRLITAVQQATTSAVSAIERIS